MVLSCVAASTQSVVLCIICLYNPRSYGRHPAFIRYNQRTKQGGCKRKKEPWMRHAILVLCLTLICCGAAAQGPIMPDAPIMRLDEIGLYTVGYAYRSQPEHAFPIGWSGYFEEQTGVACQPAGEQNGRKAFLLHCPWRNGTGITFQQFVFQLPKAERILVRGATAMRADIVGKSDGATFRVFANGRKLLDVNRTDSRWQPFE